MSVLFDSLKSSNDLMEAYSRTLTVLERKKGFLGGAYLQLTPLCNLSCKMCYAKMTSTDVKMTGSHVMRFDEWKWYIDQLAEMGTTTLNFTGGECMVHPDFEQIYNYAYDLGFGIVLLTNGSLLTDRLFQLFCEKPPNSFSITVYGGSSDTYGRLCGNSKAHHAVYSNIDRIIEKRFNLLVKYTVTSENIADLPEVYEYFKQKGIKLKYQHSLMQFNKADSNTIYKMTVDEEKLAKAEDIINKEHIFPDTDKQDRMFISTMKEYSNIPDKGIQCAAGKSICHIRWDGMMTPCVSFERIVLDPRVIGMENAWKKINRWATEYPTISECNRCPHVMRCPQCASLHYNDTGVPGIPSPRLCWKRNHPEEARIIETRLINKGFITAEELYGK